MTDRADKGLDCYGVVSCAPGKSLTAVWRTQGYTGKLGCGTGCSATWRERCARCAWCGAAAQNQLPQHHRIVMHFIVGRIHQRNRTFACQSTQLFELVEMLAHFVRIAALKLFPACGIVPEPLSQFGTGREIFHPLIQRRIYLPDATRPQSIDQYPHTIVQGGFLVCPFQPDVACGDSLTHRTCHATMPAFSVMSIMLNLFMPNPRMPADNGSDNRRESPAGMPDDFCRESLIRCGTRCLFAIGLCPMFVPSVSAISAYQESPTRSIRLSRYNNNCRTSPVCILDTGVKRWCAGCSILLLYFSAPGNDIASLLADIKHQTSNIKP